MSVSDRLDHCTKDPTQLTSSSSLHLAGIPHLQRWDPRVFWPASKVSLQALGHLHPLHSNPRGLHSSRLCSLRAPGSLNRRSPAHPPDSQLAPIIQSVESTTVRLQWSQSAKPNRKITHYEVIHRCLEREDWGDGTTQVDENVIFTESNIVRDSWL